MLPTEVGICHHFDDELGRHRPYHKLDQRSSLKEEQGGNNADFEACR
jgi:hypothetical protein